jgi:predicted metal-dependent enzyme (double-stranded beta helix superfamily)
MSQEYSLQNFIRDMDDITRDENSPAAIVAAAKPFLAKLVQCPDCIQPDFKKRGAAEYGRYMLHRAPRFNVTTVVWGPGDGAKAHNHDTWGLVGVLENEIQETRFRRLDDGAKTVDKSFVEDHNVHHSFTVSPETLVQACKIFYERKIPIDRLYYRAKGFFTGRELYFFDPTGNRLELRDPTWKQGMPEPSFEDLAKS